MGNSKPPLYTLSQLDKGQKSHYMDLYPKKCDVLLHKREQKVKELAVGHVGKDLPTKVPKEVT